MRPNSLTAHSLTYGGAKTMPPLSAYSLLHVSIGTEILRTRVFGRTEIRGTKTDHCSEHRDRKGRVMMTMMITV